MGDDPELNQKVTAKPCEQASTDILGPATRTPDTA